MRVGVQFTGTVAANASAQWYTFNWPASWHVIWHVVPTSPRTGAPQVEWETRVERANATYVTYWVLIKNLTNVPVNIEARYAVLN
ncbi:hypothetical protein BWI93_02665 [Siphonobacter sp. BAB-5385]|uniref:Uncharacterized protein n=1 Tax=Siphonobacter curvatus TaxID=2094562 RepID=A0A2S7IKJ4_9BACT|nr:MULTISPECIES: hypothetical protein [Siphonobacter]OZI09786.1 hypothetical protein BWI93_02665 [Siphonobacter sp. BAB-5385]PMD92346.1 hypothetical protein BWI97_19810 [Siphonobacter sp. BAB-5405]PQA57016.1 hypothetical protein C5O19_16945 [Siphonobacter curvatus]